MIAGKVYRNCVDTVQLLKSFDGSKVLDVPLEAPDALLSGRRFPQKIRSQVPTPVLPVTRNHAAKRNP
jgi:hypothetical protein